MSGRIKRIIQKVKAQEIELNPPIEEKEIEDFETAHGILIPDGYRQFLLQVGNGGEGPPCYGLDRLGQTAGDMPREQAREWRELRYVKEEFPFTRYWIWDQGQETDEGTLEQVVYGSMYIGNDGCASYWHLIISGPERGNVWMLAGEGIQPACPKRDFLTWYEDWLDGKDSFYAFPVS